MPEARTRNVFVYGTLRRGGRLDINRLEPAPKYIGMGEVMGRLYLIDWYPGLVLGGEGAVAVVGEVYTVAAQLEAKLDEIECIEPGDDSEYFKRDITIEVHGEPVQCFVYEINPRRIAGRDPMAHGDWMRFHPS